MGHDARLNEKSREFTGSGEVLDARRRPLKEGDEVILDVPHHVYYRIAQITPNLHPSAPPGLMIVHLGVMLAFHAQRGQVNPEFIRVRTVEEAGPANFKMLDAQPSGPILPPDPRD